MSCYYLSRRIAIVLLPVAAQSDGQSSAIAGHHGLSLAAAAEQALGSVSVQGRPLLSLVSAAPLLLQPFRQIDTIGRQAPSIEYNAAQPRRLVGFQLDTANMYSCF